jgi:hypothetical protein
MSYPLMLWLLYLGNITARQVNLKIARNLIIVSGSLMVVVVIITLTRRTIIDIIWSAIAIGFLVMLLRRSASTFFNVFKLIVPGIIIVIVISVTVPKYFSWLGEVVTNTTELILTGEDKEGRSDSRVSGEGGLILANEYIKGHFVAGSGYFPYTYEMLYDKVLQGDEFAIAYNDSAEVPLYGFILRFGAIGLFFEIIIYLILIRFSIKVFRLVRNHIAIIYESHFSDLLIILLVLGMLVNQFTINIMSLGVAFQEQMNFVVFLAQIALLYTSYYKILSSIKPIEKVR